MTYKVLLISNDSLQDTLAEGFDITPATVLPTLPALIEQVLLNQYDCVIIHHKLGEPEVNQLIREFKNECPKYPLFLISDYAMGPTEINPFHVFLTAQTVRPGFTLQLNAFIANYKLRVEELEQAFQELKNIPLANFTVQDERTFLETNRSLQEYKLNYIPLTAAEKPKTTLAKFLSFAKEFSNNFR